MTENYTEPVVQLLTMGETNINDDRDYLGMGFTREHIPELIRMVEDEILRSLPVDEKGTSRPETYAQVHAWRVLAQLLSMSGQPWNLPLRMPREQSRSRCRSWGAGSVRSQSLSLLFYVVRVGPAAGWQNFCSRKTAIRKSIMPAPGPAC